MLAQEIAPTEIGKHANIIRAAQEELANMDVLVCGRCLRAYNFVEEFQAHKEDACEKENANLKETLDSKPTIWAFTLWKATQLHTRKDANSGNSWALYQHWVKLDDSVREPWIVAGKTIQSFGKIAHGQLQDMPVRITKTVVNPNNNNTSNSNNNSSVSPTRKSPAGKLPTVANQLKDTENERPKSKPGTPTLPTASSGAVKPNNRIAIRIDSKTEQRTEEPVEKIVAKRFNPRRKTHEYLVKWVDRSHHENTWEVMANLERVPYFLQMFEKQLARQKLTREKGLDALKRMQPQGSSSKADNAAPLSPALAPSQISPSSRPSRTSKTKAMDSFKQWVNETGGGDGSSSPSSANEDESATEQEWPPSTGPVKRKLNHTDSSVEGSGLNDSMDLEDLEEDLPSHTVKRLKNGGSSVQLNKPRVQSTEKQQSKINGNSTVSGTEQRMGEIIYTEDSTSSGMFRKPEMPNTLQLKKEKPECPVRYLSRSEVASNTRGVFRVESSEASASASPAAAPPQKVSSAQVTTGVPKRLPMARPTHSGANSPITVGQRQQVLRTPGQGPTTTAIQRRPGMSGTTQVRQGLQQTPGRAHPGGRVLARAGVGTPQQRQHPQTLQGAKAVTPEQKILQLSKSGDLKVTRKVVTREELMAQRSAQARQQRQVQVQQQSSHMQRITPNRQRIAPKPAIQPTPLQMELEEEVHQHQAQLCPITGKLIGQEETQLQMEQEQQQEQQREQLEAAAQALLGSDQQVLTNEDGSALLVRGEDGTVYQVAGKNAEGQTILVTQGPDGEQQFAYVAAAEGEEQDVLSLDHAVAEAVQAGEQVEAHGVTTTSADGEQILVSMTEEELAQHQVLQQAEASAAGTGTPATAQIHITTSDSDGTEAQIPAEVVQADLPSPGGTRRVVLLLQDGTFMMTEMHEEQFKTLNIPT
ncbi:myb-like protein Q [Drosophila ficusphila]|uniref:myb-like protein Q n=1 Tax=Drosophila ficusphila TaxID=30025 RepID=UPI0007E5EFEC|nr:myb-like protein Q [Drosophila ficusphila]